MMCAGYLGGGVDSCIGDSGGPLMTVEDGFYKLCGLISFGKGCGWADYYGGYSRVCSVIDWINAYTSDSSTVPPTTTPTSTQTTTTQTTTTQTTTTGTGSTQTTWPANQGTTPSNPNPTGSSTCGHSMYYYGTNNPGAGIVGGVTAQPNQYPWIVRLQLASYLCGGTIISSTHILTAAHCTDGLTAGQITIFFADHNKNSADSGEFTRGVTQIIEHPQYNSFTFDYDYALLEISGSPLDFTSTWKVQKACLPTSCSDGCAPNTVAYIAGWGTTSEGGFTATNLRSAYVKIQEQSVCQDQYGVSDITDRMICAGYVEGGIDSCQGDSGGPMVTIEDGYYKLCGTVSWGSGCARPNNLGVYSKTCQILSWLSSSSALDT